MDCTVDCITVDAVHHSVQRCIGSAVCSRWQTHSPVNRDAMMQWCCRGGKIQTSTVIFANLRRHGVIPPPMHSSMQMEIVLCFRNGWRCLVKTWCKCAQMHHLSRLCLYHLVLITHKGRESLDAIHGNKAKLNQGQSPDTPRVKYDLPIDELQSFFENTTYNIASWRVFNEDQLLVI